MDTIVNKRLLLAKEFFLNAVELARNGDALSKMMAIHNFHNSVEITSKSILLKYKIRTEKTLNIDFESILNEIDRHEEFKSKGLKLPYRQEVRNLTQLRNLVQHQAYEPESKSMNDWILYVGSFLENTFQNYFDVKIDEVNRLFFINNENLKKLLEKAIFFTTENNYDEASCLAAAAFKYASLSILSFIPHSSSSFFITSRLQHSGINDRSLTKAFEDTFHRVDESERFSSLLSTGTSLSDYKKYNDYSPFVIMMIGGHIRFESNNQKQFTKDTAEWLINFVIASIMKWQNLNLNPEISEYYLDGVTTLLEQDASAPNA